MRLVPRLCLLPLILLALAADEPAGDLEPIASLPRPLFPAEYAKVGFNSGFTALSADGKTMVALANGNSVNVWDLAGRATQPRSVEVSDYTFQNPALSLSPDGKTLAAVTRNNNGDLAVHFFDLATGKPIGEIENDRQLSGQSYSPDGRLLAVGTSQGVELWDATDGDEVRTSPTIENAHFRAPAVSPDGKMFAGIGLLSGANLGHESLAVWETASGKERLRIKLAFGPPILDSRPRIVNYNYLSMLAFSVDSRLLATAGEGCVRVWDLLTGEQLPPLTGLRGVPAALLFPPGDRELVAVDTDGTRLSWNLSRVRRSLRVRLAPLAESDFAELWQDLGESEPFRAYRVRRRLAADPAGALSLLQRHLRPVPLGDRTRINQLIADLSSDNGGTRRKAMMELRTKHGEAALSALNSLPPNAATIRNHWAFGALHNKLRAHYATPERARALQAVAVLEDIGTPEARQLLEKVSRGADAINLTIEARAALARLAVARPPAGPLSGDERWTALDADDASVAFAAVRRLAQHPQEAVPLLRKHLQPVPLADDKRVARLLADLESDDFKRRERATEELEKYGEQVVPALRKALAGRPSLESRKRLDGLIEQLRDTSALLVRPLRAVEVLEHIATPEARQVLQSLAGGAPPACLTREARASLQRLARR